MKKPVKVVCALVALGAMSLVSSAFAATGECTLQGMYQSSLIFNWNDTGIWKDGYVPQSGDDVTFPTKPNRTLTVRLPSASGFEFNTVSGTAGFFLVNGTGNDRTRSYTIDDASEFLGSWYLKNHNTLKLSAGEGETPALNQLVSNGGPVVNQLVETAAVAEIYGSGAVTKSGAGTLSVGRLSGATSLTVSQGDVTFAGQETGLEGLDAVLAKADIHYDASDRSFMTLDANDRATLWKNLASDSKNAAPPTIAAGASSGQKYPGPLLVPGYQNGKAVLDFGPVCSASAEDPLAAGSAALTFSRDVTVKCYFIVVADRDPNAAALQDMIGDTGDARWARPANGGLYAAETEPATDVAEVFVNGERVLPTHQLTGTDLKVISLRSQIGNIGSYCPIESIAFRSNRSGGLRVGEVLRYSTRLTDAEMGLVTRYLVKKWVPAHGGAVRQAESLILAKDSADTVGVTGEGTFAAKQVLATNGRLVKTGEGTLVADAVLTKGVQKLDVEVQGGDVQFGGDLQGVASAVAEDPLYHFDANAGSFTFADGLSISAWADARGGERPHMQAQTSFTKGPCALPSVVSNALNGLPVVSFGSRYASGSSAETLAKAAGMKLSANPPRAAVKEGFYVAKRVYDTSFPLGSQTSYNFHPNDGFLLSQYDASEHLIGGSWSVDGLPVADPFNESVYSAYHLIHFVASERVQFDTFAQDRSDPIVLGGVQMAEAVLYDRELTVAERYATEAALLKKWFDKAHPLVAPQAVDLAYTDTADHAVGGAGDLAVGTLSAAGKVEKVGDGAMTVGTLAGATALKASEGSLSIASPLANALAKATLHLDASDTNTLEFAEDSREYVGKYVAKWSDVRGNGRYAEAFTGCYHRPAYVENACNGLGVVNLGRRTDWAYINNAASTMRSGMLLDSTVKAKEVFLAYRQNHTDALPFILTYRNGYDFHRSDDSSFFNTTYAPNFKDEKLFVDLEETDNSYKYKDTNYRVLAVTAKEGTYGNVNSLCVDRSQTIGGNSYGEVILFEEPLTAEERTLIRQYLLKKWRNLELEVPDPSFTSLAAAKGATLSLGYANADTAALAGSGTIAGNVTLAENGTVTANFGTDGSLAPLTVEGALSLPANGKVVVTSESLAKLKGGDYALILSDSLKAGLLAWTVEAPESLKRSFSVRLEDGRLVLTVIPPGLTVILR